MLSGDSWEFPYSRQKAAYPLAYVSENKFWPSVRRVDEAFGDRNLVCSCASIDSYVSYNLQLFISLFTTILFSLRKLNIVRFSRIGVLIFIVIITITY